ncbi:MAG: peptidylprolyl isomerase [Candidatus Thiodiazotropha sp. (ex Ustalcina ferruginea)]|nr:peptidylprolyl isomerase [Candidatus Thiodiazotropha sp. (ex Ustalcina ferruginea)]
MRLKHVVPAALLTLFGPLALTGCSDTGEPSSEGQVVADVNGKAIHKTTFDAYLNHKRIAQDNEKLVERELNVFLEREGLAEVILQQKVLDAEQIQVEVNEFKKQMLASRYFEQYLRDKVNEAAIRNFYAANPARFQTRKAHVAHILIRTNPKMSQQEREALLTKAQETYSKAVSNQDFVLLAKQYSEDLMSVKKGGDLGWITEGSIDPAFTKAAFGLKTGEVSQPVTTPFGFHIIKVLEEAQIVKQPYERVKGDIRFELRQQAKQAEMKRLMALVSINKRG